MKKRAYKASNLNSKVAEKLISQTEGRKLIVGIDVAKTVQFAAFRVDEKEVLETVKWSHPTQTKEFVEMLTSLPTIELKVALESTGSYGDAIRHQLLRSGVDVYRVSAKQCSDAKELYDGVHSTHDAKAAALIAWLHDVKPGEKWPIENAEDRLFKSLVKQTSYFDEQYYVALNKLEAELARYWPELPRVLSLTTVTTLKLLAQYGGPEDVKDNAEQATELMAKTGGAKLSQLKIEQISQSARDTVGVAQHEMERELVKLLARDALRALRSRDKVKKVLEKQADAVPEVSNMSQAVGKTTASVLFAKVGAPSSFPNAASFEKSCGLNLKEFSSGKHKGGLRITKRGSSEARKYLYMAALRMLYKDPVMAAWYSKKVERDGGVKLKAVIALMRKITRALWHVAQGNKFDSTLLFDVTRLRLVTR